MKSAKSRKIVVAIVMAAAVGIAVTTTALRSHPVTSVAQIPVAVSAPVAPIQDAIGAVTQIPDAPASIAQIPIGPAAVADKEDAGIKSVDTSDQYAAERKRVGNRNLVKTNSSAVLPTDTLAVTGAAAEPRERPATAALQSVDQAKSADVPVPPASATSPVENQNMGTVAEVAAADSQITAAVKSEIAVDSFTKDANIGVITTHGVVSLTGSLASQDAIDRARNVAAQVRNVKSVDTSALILVKAPDAS